MSILIDNLNKIKNSAQGLSKKIQTDLTSFIHSGSSKYEIADVGLDIIGDEKVVLENDVTDNYVETNIAYQDQISIKPVTYTISGEVGELVYYKNDNDNSILTAVPEKLTQVASFVPSISSTVSSVRDKAIKVSNILNSVDNFANRVSKLTKEEDLQTRAFNRLVQLRNTREPINVRCPWGILTGFVITRIEFTQESETKDKTKITISFKELRTTQLGETLFDSDRYQGVEKLTRSPLVEKGQTTGSVVDFSKDKIGSLF